jgi:DNA-directed RNA polymerase specialized sigma24 family protein
MPTAPKASRRASVLAAQERYDADTETARESRREAFAKAQREGLTLREIGEIVGLHHTRVSQIIRGE